MASSTRQRHRYRCSVCKTRFAVRLGTRREPRCPACGEARRVYSIEASRRRELAKQDTCWCGMYPFPHRRGSLRFCLHHPLAGTDPTEEEHREFEACMRTRRSDCR